MNSDQLKKFEEVLRREKSEIETGLQKLKGNLDFGSDVDHGDEETDETEEMSNYLGVKKTLGDSSITTCPISRCSGPIPGNSLDTVAYGNITFVCGDQLALMDVLLSWTDAGTGSTCANHDCKEIAPKCGTAEEIVIVLLLFGNSELHEFTSAIRCESLSELNECVQ